MGAREYPYPEHLAFQGHVDKVFGIVKQRIGSPQIGDTVLRRDAAHGNASMVDKTIEGGYIFLFKGMRTVSAQKYGKRVKEWVTSRRVAAAPPRKKSTPERFGPESRARSIEFGSSSSNV